MGRMFKGNGKEREEKKEVEIYRVSIYLECGNREKNRSLGEKREKEREINEVQRGM